MVSPPVHEAASWMPSARPPLSRVAAWMLCRTSPSRAAAWMLSVAIRVSRVKAHECFCDGEIGIGKIGCGTLLNVGICHKTLKTYLCHKTLLKYTHLLWDTQPHILFRFNKTLGEMTKLPLLNSYPFPSHPPKPSGRPVFPTTAPTSLRRLGATPALQASRHP
jgi:hypothetical protein